MSSTHKLQDRRLIIAMVLVPFVLAVVYYVFLSADRFVSFAQVVVRQEGRNPEAQLPGLSMLLTGTNPASREETLYLREYIVSMDMMDLLEKRLQWVERYSQQRKDVFFWLSKDAPREDLLAYYQRMVSAHYDETTGLLRVEVQAFTPELAKQMVKVILQASEQFVNEVSHSMAREQMRFAVNELESARNIYTQHQDALLQFQHAHKVLDGKSSADSRAALISAIEAEYSRAQVVTIEMLYKLHPDSPQVKHQQQRVKALREQLDAEKRVLVSAPDGDQLNVQASHFQQLTLDAGIAEQIYKAAVTAVENARVEASKKIRTLVTVVSANTPQIALYPQRVYNVLTILMVLFIVYGITRFVIASIEDHRE
ncbi:ABC transporter permease [Pseudomonas sp. 6D_7.1_Bac1]|jgi:capsular polysaccharide transport system permease protein|uniref:ABC transporter permease n=1 Tax=Pseudomonas sp. 6D_7.1_Bac1 TaxID=2971615 RepID=UPI0021CABEB1|nr:ABC transporter permease [Pseudomonas sp. 6D_7.1_Bac1]MCU1750291.1 ABC transporter permease [Pseudomonas sp. 6D_7.1_Bac1]